MPENSADHGYAEKVRHDPSQAHGKKAKTGTVIHGPNSDRSSNDKKLKAPKNSK